jgi:hypothetical protein
MNSGKTTLINVHLNFRRYLRRWLSVGFGTLRYSTDQVHAMIVNTQVCIISWFWEGIRRSEGILLVSSLHPKGQIAATFEIERNEERSGQAVMGGLMEEKGWCWMQLTEIQKVERDM